MSKITLAGLACALVIGIPVAGPTWSSLFEHVEMTVLSLEGKGGMRGQPGMPHVLVFRRNRLGWMTRGMEQIEVVLGRPDQCMRRWFWHRLLVHNRYPMCFLPSPQHG